MSFNFVEFIKPKIVAANLNSRNTDYENYLHRAFFDHKNKASIDLAFIKGSKGVPVTLMPTAFDAKATFRDRIAVEKIEAEMPFFREGFHISEKLKIDFARGSDADDPYVQEALNYVFDDAEDLINGARVVPERETMQLLFPVDGNIGISIKANGVDYTYNYDPNGTWKKNNYIVLSGNDKWDAPATADPVKTLEDAKSQIETVSGAKLGIAVMNTNTYNKMAATASMLARANRNNTSALYATRTEIENVLNDFSETALIVYNGKYRNEAKEVKNFIPDGYVAYLPNDGVALGSVWYAKTPEELDAENFAGREVAIVEDGVAITVVPKEHPVNTDIFASEICLPSFERMDDFACIKVY